MSSNSRRNGKKREKVDQLNASTYSRERRRRRRDHHHHYDEKTERSFCFLFLGWRMERGRAECGEREREQVGSAVVH